MPRELSSILIKLQILFMGLQGAGVLLSAQTAQRTPQELDQLLAPVALYPDALLSQITTASTNPQEILDVHAWLQTKPGLTGVALATAAEKQGFDPAFIALVNFPQVLEMMAQHVDDYAAIGQAFSADQESVTASIQRLRAQAYNYGALRTTEQQKLEVQQSAGQTTYVIQPVNPTVVYVPLYDPTAVYVRPVPGAVVAAPVVTFHAGIGIGALIVDNRPWGWGGWGWNWGAPRLLQSRLLERLGKSLSSAALLVSSPADRVGQPSGISRRLGLSSPQLPSTSLLASPLSSAAARTSRESAGREPSIARQAGCARKAGKPKSGKTRTGSSVRPSRQARDAESARPRSHRTWPADDARRKQADASRSAVCSTRQTWCTAATRSEPARLKDGPVQRRKPTGALHSTVRAAGQTWHT
jgi:hypothetical protein